MYISPNIESSYQPNDIGKVLYDTVIEYKPKKIIEFGCLYGYSTVALAQGIRDLDNGGSIVAYDLWDKYPFKHTHKEYTQNNIEAWTCKVDQFVELKDGNFYEWLDNPEPFDMLHLDISNTGDIIYKAYFKLIEFIKNGSIIVFEGGTLERDNIEWMIKYNKVKITDYKSQTNYKVLTNKFPGLSIIKQ